MTHVPLRHFLRIFVVLYANSVFMSVAQSDNKPATTTQTIDRETGAKGYSIPDRLVHLDLKGAPPRIEVLEQFIPLVASLGATGLLVEYEDMFPYSGRLAILKAYNAYSVEDVKRIVQLAADNQLKVVSLVQSIGHLGFLLKWQQFASLRTEPREADTVCVCDTRVKSVLKEMIRQVVELHSNIQMIHIGSDEGRNIKRCSACASQSESESQLQLRHITKLAQYVNEDLNLTRVLIWYDIAGTTKPSLLKELQLDKLVEPVVWGYSKDVTRRGYYPDGMFKRYSQTFERVWLAGAFKGANSPSSQKIEIETPYLQNVKSYMKLLTENWADMDGRNPGMILTGWSRYRHFAPLCELLPMGLPSLAVLLQFLRHNTTIATTQLFGNASKSLNCTPSCPNPSLDVECFLNCTDFGNEFRNLFKRRDELRNVHKDTFRQRIASDVYKVAPLQDDVESARKKLYIELQHLFHSDTVQEWLENYFDIYYVNYFRLCLSSPLRSWTVCLDGAGILIVVALGLLLAPLLIWAALRIIVRFTRRRCRPVKCAPMPQPVSRVRSSGGESTQQLAIEL